MRWIKVRMKSNKRRYRLRARKTNSTTRAPNRKLEIRTRRNGRKNLWYENRLSIYSRSSQGKRVSTKFYPASATYSLLSSSYTEEKMGTCTNGSSRKVSDASTQIPIILLARRTGKVWYYQGHPKQVETLPSLKKNRQQRTDPRQQWRISTPHQVVNPVPSNRQIFVCT